MLDHAQLPHHERQCQASSGTAHADASRRSGAVLRRPCQVSLPTLPTLSPSGGGGRSCENFLYGFKGARSAPCAVRRVLPREVTRPDEQGTGRPAWRGGRKRPRDTHRRRTGSSALAPFGARRAAARAQPRAAPVPGRPPSRPPTVPAWGTAILPALQCEAVQDNAQGASRHA